MQVKSISMTVVHILTQVYGHVKVGLNFVPAPVGNCLFTPYIDGSSSLPPSESQRQAHPGNPQNRLCPGCLH